MTFAFQVFGQALCPGGIQPRVVSDSVDFVSLLFKLDASWDGLVTVAQFTQDGAVYHQVLDGDGGCTLPSEITTGTVELMLFGQMPGGTTRATTQPINIPIVRSGFVGDGDTPIPPTADLYSQLLEKMAQGGGTSVTYGDGLHLTGDVLSVDTTDAVEEDNTKPITSGAVYDRLGDIESLLASI